jgi:predicted SnoaL-like aldol condensation-catalyzing enzyme
MRLPIIELCPRSRAAAGQPVSGSKRRHAMMRKHGVNGTRIGLLVSLMLLVAGNVATSAATAAAPDDVLGNRGVAQQFFDEVLNEGNTAATEALVSRNASLHVPGGEFHGSTGCAELVAAIREAYPGATFEVRDMIVDGDTVVVSWTLANIGGNGEAPPTVTASGASVDGVALLRIDNYLVVEVWMR